jgi:CRP/FNR family cyclic AMP-dependent transcriptional regulator
MGQGDDGDNLLIILTGFARVSMVASNGHEIVLDYAEPGYVIGEIAFLDGGPRTASIEALTELTALSLTRPAFEEIAERHVAMPRRMLRVMAKRLRQANDVIEADRAFTSGPGCALSAAPDGLGGKRGQAEAGPEPERAGHFRGFVT